MEIKRDNPNALQAINLRLKELSSKQGKVGWFSSAKYGDGTQVAYVAAIQEFGSPERSIPPRPFMRPAVAENEKKWKDLAGQQAREILAGNLSADDAMLGLTSAAESAVYKKIVSIDSPALSQITLGLRKLKTKPEYKSGEKKITGATVGEVAALLKAGKLDVSGVSTKPLNDSGYMLSTLTSVVENANT